MAKILVVDDDKQLCVVLQECLEAEHHAVEVSNDGVDATERLRSFSYDLVVLDWDLPLIKGIEVLRRFRAAGGQIPILMLTGKREIDDKELGFDSGADDYLTKPFDLRELRARSRALLSRPPARKTGILQAGDMVLDLASFTATKSGKEVALSPKEFALLEFLIRHEKEVCSADRLLKSIWKAEEAVGPETIKTHIKNIRAKIDNHGQPSLITTVYGLGYKIDSTGDTGLEKEHQ